ncbi:DUF4399 domain-containing protein [Roseivirga misakiensis]|uniref:Rod shape-determining protein RodA n=1 Tax=Roseivirga misakiensis TaxID=1563681 RepID=A0A1E5SZ97_9BACT|nr:DUF4399 domain-containing protein [Roseivirga misakiensis]OEK04442.1 rod shape-determining protein RodA [Roseivirga misakiensis]
MRLVKKLFVILLVVSATWSCSQKEGVSFENLEDGQEVSSPVLVKMGVSGMEVQPAGEVVKGTGHHHMIIDGSFIKTGVPVPANDTHIHYGKGQVEAELNLSPGEHTLTLQFANGIHQSYGEEWSKTITINVK